MQAIPIGYRGPKEFETDTRYGTGLTWVQGDIHEVSRDQAELLLSHPDIWFDARKPKAIEKDPIKPRTMSASIYTEDEPFEEDTVFVRTPPLESMTEKPVLMQLAKAKFNVDLADSLTVGQMQSEVHKLMQERRYA